MKILQRSINVLAVLFFAFSLYIPFDVVGDKLDAFFKVFGIGLVLILIANYIFIGKLTLWNKVKKDE
jgi:hypothetical protein